MNTIKSLGLAGLATAALFAGQAFATPLVCPSGTQGSPTCIAPVGNDGAGTGLNSMYGPGGSHVGGSTGLDIYNGQYTPSSQWQIGATSGSFNIILNEIAGNANLNTFGIYDPSNMGNTLQLFGGTDSAGAKGTLVYNGGGNFQFAIFGETASSATFGNGATFGYYLGTPNGIFYSDPNLNNGAGEAGNPYANGMHHMVAYQGGNGTKLNGASFLSNEFMLAWEDQAFTNSDLDYNDFIVLVESVHSVPEPAALGMFGLGALLIGAFVGLRRREQA
jgi:hypothetical protein